MSVMLYTFIKKLKWLLNLQRNFNFNQTTWMKETLFSICLVSLWEKKNSLQSLPSVFSKTFNVLTI